MFLDNFDDAGGRERSTATLLNQLGYRCSRMGISNPRRTPPLLARRKNSYFPAASTSSIALVIVAESGAVALAKYAATLPSGLTTYLLKFQVGALV